jgi:Carboxypeptidase regulatory-like domain/TonB dependent receptor
MEMQNPLSIPRVVLLVTVASIYSAVSLLAAPTAHAQASTFSSVTGTVVDAQGGVVSGASVTIVNTGTSLTREATTGNNGYFTISPLPPGRYKLTVKRDGFQIREINDVVLNVNDQPAFHIQLVASGVTATVTVTAGAPILQTQSAELSALVSERRVKELPLNGKDFNDLLRLAPGVGGDNPGNPPTPGTNPSVSGARVAGNTFTIDGADANDERLSYAGLSLGGGAASFDGNAPNLISTEAIQEFRLLTTNADATFGRGSGGQVNVITKSGTNDFHGSLYHYLRNEALDARNFFNNAGPIFDEQGRSKNPPFKQHLFGGSFGGPLVLPRFGEGGPVAYLGRNRHFIFGNYEGFRQKRRVVTRLFAPNADQISITPGDLGRFYRAFYLDRGVVPPSGIGRERFFPLSDLLSPDQAATFGYPRELFDGATANGEAGSIEISDIATDNIDQDAFLIRTDHLLTNRLTASFRYAFAQPTRVFSTVVPIDLVEQPARWQNALAQFIYQVSPSQIIEARGMVLRSVTDSRPLGGVDPGLLALGVSPELGIAIFPSSGDSQLFVATSNGVDAQTIPQGALLHTLTRGNITFRSGFDIRRQIINQANVFGAQPTYLFNGTFGPNGILGSNASQSQAVPSSTSATVFGAGGGPTTPLRGFRATEQEYFVQADWRVHPQLTLNLGLRYSYFGVYSEVNDAVSNLYGVDSAGRIVPDVSPFDSGRGQNRIAAVGGDIPFYQPDRNNFQPRLGIAWDLGGRGRTVLRAGYGLYYDRLYQFIFSGTVNNPPFAVSSNAVNVAFRLGVPFPFSPVTTPPQISAVDPNIRNPQVQRFNVAIEQKLFADTSVTAAYVGSRARDLIRTLEVNGGSSVPLAVRPDPSFTTQRLSANFSRSNYDSLQVFVKRRFARGLDFTVAYTFSKLTDDNALDRNITPPPSLINLGAEFRFGFQGGGAQFAPRPREADRGISDLDVRHNLTISHVIDLPFGRGRRFFSTNNGLVSALIGNFSLTGIARLTSGTRFTVTRGRDDNDDGDTTFDRPSLLTGAVDDLYAGGSQGRTQFLVPATDALTRLGVPDPVTDPFAAMSRNMFRSASVKLYDVSLIKRFVLGENVRLGFEINAFNVFNHVNFGMPVANLLVSGAPNQTFGQVQSTRTPPRQLQFGTKLEF